MQSGKMLIRAVERVGRWPVSWRRRLAVAATVLWMLLILATARDGSEIAAGAFFPALFWSIWWVVRGWRERPRARPPAEPQIINAEFVELGRNGAPRMPPLWPYLKGKMAMHAPLAAAVMGAGMLKFGFSMQAIGAAAVAMVFFLIFIASAYSLAWLVSVWLRRKGGKVGRYLTGLRGPTR